MAGEEKSLTELDRAVGFLSYLLATCHVTDDGTVLETRQRVAQIDGVTIHVYADEHAPPHFHVICSGKNASYTIEDCTLMKGALGRREEYIVKDWFAHRGKYDLIKAWNQTRPGDCTVGKWETKESSSI